MRLQVEKKEENLSYSGRELRCRMWWAKRGMDISDAEQLFSSSSHQPWHKAPGVRSGGALQR